MLDLKFIRDNPDVVRRAMRAKMLGESEPKLDQLLMTDEELRIVRRDLEALQAERNASSKLVGEMKRRGENDAALMDRLAAVSDDVKRLEDKARSLQQQLDGLLLEIPNLPHESVPYGESEHDNVVVKEWGSRPEFDFTPVPHWELLDSNGWVLFDAGVTLTGAGFPVFKGTGARLVRGLQAFFLDRATRAGFEEVVPPLVVNAASATATGQLPDKEGQMYEVTGGLYLVPTSEVALTNLHRDEILDDADLPIRYSAYTPCFRREAGSHGANVRGLNRVHQFDKVELVQFCHPDVSYQALEEMTRLSEQLLEELELPYRKLLMCTGDIGFTQAKKYDLEVWSAGQERWLEVSSISNLEAFQATRLKTRFRPGGVGGKGKPEPVHTLNGSALAFPRTIAALIENGQRADGSVVLPAVLEPFVGTTVLA